MSSPEPESRLNSVLLPSLHTIINNGSWRKNTKLVHQSKSLLDHLTSSPAATATTDDTTVDAAVGPLNDGVAHDFSLSDSELILSPFLNAAGNPNPNIAAAGVTALQKLISHGYLRGDADESELLTRCVSVLKFVSKIRRLSFLC